VDPFDEISRSLQAHPSKAQILVEVEDEGNALERALGILKDQEIHPMKYQIIRKGNPTFVLFYISTNDMREAVLILTEAGFTKLKGINSKGVNPKIDMRRTPVNMRKAG